MAPARMRARVAAALGTDLVRATRLLEVSAICWLLLAHAQGGYVAFAGASMLTITLHAVLKRLNDMRGEVERRQRLAVIGQTASTVFHQLGRHHGAIGMYAHLLARGEQPPAVAEHARRILASVDDANRVIDELLAFGQDRTLNLYPHRLESVVDECVDECRPRALATRSVRVARRRSRSRSTSTRSSRRSATCSTTRSTPRPGQRRPGRASVVNGSVRVAVRDHGTGVASEIRAASSRRSARRSRTASAWARAREGLVDARTAAGRVGARRSGRPLRDHPAESLSAWWGGRVPELPTSSFT
jgi:signal transduction histidine kinase